MLQYPRRSRFALVSSLLALLVLAAAPTSATAAQYGAPPAPRPLTIAQARAAPVGSVVTVEGTVTTPSGVFDSSYFDDGFGIQDRTAGIFVSFPTTNIDVDPPRHVVVTGKIQKPAGGLLMIAPAGAGAVRVGRNDRPVEPRWLRTGAVGDPNQGLLVRAVGRIVSGPTADPPYGSKLFVDDGSGRVNVYVNVGTGVDLRPFRTGQLVVVTGFSSEFNNLPEIDIRGPRDLVRLGR